MEIGEIGVNFSLELPLPTPSCNEITQSTSLKNCLSTFNFFPVSFFLLLMSISRENKTKLKKMLI